MAAETTFRQRCAVRLFAIIVMLLVLPALWVMIRLDPEDAPDSDEFRAVYRGGWRALLTGVLED